MHELSLAESALRLIEDAAEKQGFRHVRTVWLEIGQLACVEQEAMRFCFDAVIKDSVADGARLVIVETAGWGKCAQCGTEMQIATLYEACPNCGSYDLKATRGKSLRVIELEVE